MAGLLERVTMRVLIIGGTRFTGPELCRRLMAAGHQVTVYHRGNHAGNIPSGVEQIPAPKNSPRKADHCYLRESAPALRAVRADVVINMVAYRREDAQAFVEVFGGAAGRTVVPSSVDVYLAYGRIHGTEPGPIVPMPLHEESPLRQKLSIHAEGYEKRWVEEVVMSAPDLPGTILRYPAIYGPRDYRLYEWARRILDRRPALLLERGWSDFRFTHGYADDVALATKLAVENPVSAGRTYNVGELHTPTVRQRLGAFCAANGYDGRIVEIPYEESPYNPEKKPWVGQDWEIDSSRIRNELGFAEQSDYQQSLRNTFEWQRDHPKTVDPKEFNYAAEDELIAKYG